MYKTINLYVLFFSLFLFSFTDGNNKKKNDLENGGMKGKVKSVRYYSYDSPDEKILAINPRTISKSDTAYYETNDYNEKGNITESNWHHRDEEGTDLNNRYDETGNKVESTSYNSSGKIKRHEYNKYDANSNIIENTGTLYFKDSLNFDMFYKYDAKGNMVETNYNQTSKDRHDLYKRIYLYDERGNCIEDYSYRDDGLIKSKFVRKYDADNNITEMDYYHDSLVSKHINKYNDYGNMIEDLNYDHDNKLVYDHVYKYEYDEKGNWIKQIRYDKDKVTDIEIRVIEYY